MAISTQISRLTTLRNSIRTKLIDLGILPAASTSATLSECYNVLSTVTGLAATSYTPTTTTQTISSGYYLKGAQTINAIPSTYIIPNGTSSITSNGIYDVKAYTSASVSVPYTGRMITISGNGGEGCWFRINNTGNYYYQNGTSVNFDDGDSMYITCEGIQAGGSIYVNGALVSGGAGVTASYVMALPHEDVLVQMSYGGMARIDVNYNVLGSKNITENGTYIASSDYLYGYSQVSVNVPIPTGYLIPTGTITLSSSGTYDVASYASADVTVTGGPSSPYMYSITVGGAATMSGSMNGLTSGISGFAACCRLGGFDNLFSLQLFSTAMFYSTEFYLRSSIGYFSNYYNSETGIYNFVFSSITQLLNAGSDCFLTAYFSTSTSLDPLPHVDLIFPNVSRIHQANRAFAFQPSGSLRGWYRLSFPIATYFWGESIFSPGERYSEKRDFYSGINYIIPESGQLCRYANTSYSYISTGGFLSEIYVPELTSISGDYMFAYCFGLSSIDFPKLTKISGNGTFLGCINLECVSMPMLSYISSYNGFTFAGCANLTSLYLPSLNTVASYFLSPIYKSLGGANYFSSTAYLQGNYMSALSISYPCGVSIVSLPAISNISVNNVFTKAINLREAYFNSLEKIGSGFAADNLFSYCPLLSVFYAPLLNYISCQNMFNYCIGLSQIELPELQIISRALLMFGNCSNLQTVSFPKLERIDNVCNSMFADCINLQTVYMPSLSIINSSANYLFQNCSLLSKISFPKLEYIYHGTYMFRSCKILSSVSFPLLSYFSSASGTFVSCPMLQKVSFPELLSMSYAVYMFSTCPSLSCAFFDKLSSINNMSAMFYGCSRLISLFLLGSLMLPLGSSPAAVFTNTPMSSNNNNLNRLGSIYVPSSLLASYKAATNWTIISSKIFAYESFFGTIGSFGYVNPAWTPLYSSTFTTNNASGNGYYYATNNSFFESLGSHCIVVFDDVIYPLATYSSNRYVFGAAGANYSFAWDYYPFHFDSHPYNTSHYIYVQSSGTHTIKIYDQLP